MNRTKRILMSLVIVGGVAAAVGLGTSAFFSDTETSRDNVFQAGAIDLLIDNDSWYFGAGEVLEHRDDLSWQLDDLDGHFFFNYADLKPGDWGEDTVSIHVDNNDAWVCTDLVVSRNDDYSSTEPELEDGDDPENPIDSMDGELANELNLFFWVDDGDNVYEVGERMLIAGPASTAIGGLSYALADSTENNVGGDVGQPLTGSETYHIGKVWCYGALEMIPVEEDDSGPGDRNKGVHCNGSEVTNMSQTDVMLADLSFYAVQQRHNTTFECSSQHTPENLLSRNLENKDDGWDVIDDNTWGMIYYSTEDSTFHGVVLGQGLEPDSKYQITLNSQPNTACGFTATSLGEFGSTLFESGFWASAFPNLAATCTGVDEGLYNMNLIADHYTFETNASGQFTYPFNLDLPNGTYSNVKVLVKKMLDTHVSPWVDTSVEHTTNLFEVAAISFIVN